MEKLTKKEFDKLSHGKIFATGRLPNSPEGIFMSDEGGNLRWVAVKGYANDWTIYCHWETSSWEYVKNNGDKVINEQHVKRCVPCDEEVFKYYRF